MYISKFRWFIKINCLMEVREMRYVNNEIISQKVRTLSKNGGFRIGFLKRLL